jgi:hypothetical protein
MKHKSLFVAVQVIALVIAGIVVSSIAIAASGGSRNQSVPTISTDAPVILQSSTPSSSPSPSEVEEQSPEVDPNSSNSRYGKTNEDSPLYQQCMLDLQAARSDYEAKIVQHNNYYSQINAEYMDVTSRAAQYQFGSPEFDELSRQATELMGQIQSGINPYEMPQPINWHCGYNGKFYFPNQ